MLKQTMQMSPQIQLHKWCMKACLIPVTHAHTHTPRHSWAHPPSRTERTLVFCLFHTLFPCWRSVKLVQGAALTTQNHTEQRVTTAPRLTCGQFEAVYLQEASTQNNQGHHRGTVLTAAQVAVEKNPHEIQFTPPVSIQTEWTCSWCVRELTLLGPITFFFTFFLGPAAGFPSSSALGSEDM